MRVFEFLSVFVAGAIAQATSLSSDSDDDSSILNILTGTAASSTGMTTTTSSSSTITSPPSLSIQHVYGLSDNETFLGSVVNADQLSTTIALECVNDTDPLFCIHGFNIDATYGPSGFYLSTSTQSAGATVDISYSCAIAGTTSLACSQSWLINAEPITSVQTSWTTTITGDVPFATVSITGGRQKLIAASTVPHKNAGGKLTIMGARTERGAVIGLTTAMVVVGGLAFML